MHISLFYLPRNTIIFYGTVALFTETADTTEAVAVRESRTSEGSWQDF